MRPTRSRTLDDWTAHSDLPVVRIRLSDERPAPQPDPLGRQRIGYAAGLSAAALWERARGVWKAKLTTLVDCKLAVVVHDDKVVAVGTIESITPYNDRVAVIGRPLTDHPLLGQPDPVPNSSRNPIAYGTVSTVLPSSPPPRPAETVLADAIEILTEAARLRRLSYRSVPGSPDGWEPELHQTEAADWAEFVTAALAGATANIGGIDAILRGRPGSWEAAGVRSLLESTVGTEEEHLLRHRTEPLHIVVHVDEILSEHATYWSEYDAAEDAIQERYEAAEAADPETNTDDYLWLYVPGDDVVWTPVDPAAPAWSIEAWREAFNVVFPNPQSRADYEALLLDPESSFVTATYLPKSPQLGREFDVLEAARHQRLQPVAMLEELLDAQREREVSDYGHALAKRVKELASAIPDLAAPVIVSVDLTGSSEPIPLDDPPRIEAELVAAAVRDVASPIDLPGTPLSRFLAWVNLS